MRVLALIAAVCILTAFASAQPEPRFDPKDVVRQVRGVERGASGVERPGLDGGEFLIDTSTALGPALYDQGEPAIAFDGANFLVVWTDYRSSSDIYGARVTPQGTVLDPGGIVISEAADDQSSPAIAFDGTDFLVVWTDERSGSSDVYGARVTPQGAVLDSSGIAISPMAGNQYFPSLVFVGTNFLVVWSDGRAGNSDIYGARVTPQGAVLDPDGFVISQAAYEQRSPALGFDGANFLVVWEDSRSTGPDESDIYGARVTPQGTVLDPDGFVISDDTNYQHSPALGFDGANFLVAWEDSRGGYDWAIYGARVTPQGTVLDPDGFVISEEAYFQQSPALGFDGANFLVAWEDARGGVDWDVYGARITPQGVVLDPDGLVILQAAYGQDTPTLGFDGANFLVAWADGRGGSSDIYGARVTPQGTVLDPSGLAVSQTVYWQWSPAVGFDGTNFLVAWTDERSGSSDIYGARVTPQGTVLDPSGFVISQAAYGQESPALGFDGANFLVVWQHGRGGSADIYGARVTPQGTVLDPSGFVISQAASSQYGPALGFDGANFLVVWEDYRSGSGGSDIYGARVTPQGTVLDPSGFVISQAAYEQLSPALGFDGANFLVVWHDYRSRDYHIYGTRVTPQGTVLTPDGFVISQGEYGEAFPALGFDGANFLVVWYAYGVGPRICGARVTPAGTVLDPSGIPISPRGGTQAVVFDGVDYFVVWRDYRGGGFDFYGARVSPGGVVFDSGPVVRQEGGQNRPKLARGAGSQLFLVYEGWVGMVGDKSYNTQRIWGKMDPSTGVVGTPIYEVRTARVEPTIVRGVLLLSDDRRPGTGDRAALLDIAGRSVMRLQPGANDVRALAPGVYFVRSKPSAVTKVVVQR